MRRYPMHLPEQAWISLSRADVPLFMDDAGWLFDAVRAAPKYLKRLPGDGKFSRTPNIVRSIIGRRGYKVSTISLIEWVEGLREIPEAQIYDPRAGEWTALEIIRQLAVRVQSIERGQLSDLDRLHPANICVPAYWLKNPDESSQLPEWTWEGWQKAMRAKENAVDLAKTRLPDYRYKLHEFLAIDGRDWEGRLYGVGLLLFGLLRLNFSLPGIWNIRGQERARSEFVRHELEELAVSSWTLAILEGCILPRSRETLLIDIDLFSAFFQRSVVGISDDTRLDPPIIKDPEGLQNVIQQAQAVLEKNQITVRNHRPRQLIPARIAQIGGDAWTRGDDEEDGM